MKRAAIIAGGDFNQQDKRFIKENDYIICADSGLDHALRFGITPDIVLGDFDSVRSHLGGYKVIRFPKQKDQTDSQLCVEYALKNGFFDITILGGMGSRVDHSIGNLFLLYCIMENGGTGRLVNQYNTVMVTRQNMQIQRERKFVSLIPLTDCVTGVQTKDLLYPLIDETLYFGQTRGISNEFLKDQCEIQIKSGTLLIILSDE